VLFATVRVAPDLLKGLEREKGFEPSTSTLATRFDYLADLLLRVQHHSTAEVDDLLTHAGARATSGAVRLRLSAG
jgi:hypothetical protein